MSEKSADLAKIISFKGEKDLKKSKACPICKKPAVAGYSPFCSKRCADIDLGRWLNGNYAIPAEENAAIADDFDDDDEY
ncbi:MAG: DNA gyrase inhibitor YacG [Rhodospirillaceae bacterium]|nr:DNA gyrase inhibitor YacG [Rhodospirillaceae bacterium]